MIRLPLFVNVRDLTALEIDHLCDLLVERFGAEYFRDKTLLEEVLKDRIERARQPYNFLYGPYLCVVPKNNGILRISSVDAVADLDMGGTVYAYDQVLTLLANESEQVYVSRPRQG